jgi:magnesium transporter
VTDGPDDDDLEQAPLSRRLGMAHEPVAASPGTLRIDSDVRPKIYIVDYGPEHVEERLLESVEEILPYLEKDSKTWIDVHGLGHKPTFERLGEILGIHPLALEDMVNVPQRPKTDVYPSQQLIVSRMVELSKAHVVTEQLSILFGKGFVLTVQEEPEIDCLDPLRERIRSGRGQLRTLGTDYLAYALFDTVIDGFFPVLEHFGEVLEDMEVRALDGRASTSADIFQLKRELLHLRRAIWPQRDLLASLLRDETPHIQPETRVYLRDTYDHAVQVMDMVETFREIASSLMDLVMTGVSNRLNEVMKVLTILSTIFLPMTFVAGVYGMNFDTTASPWNMPELKWALGYPFAILLMIGSAGGMLLFYRSQGWIGRRGDSYADIMRAVVKARRAAAGRRQKPIRSRSQE